MQSEERKLICSLHIHQQDALSFWVTWFCVLQIRESVIVWRKGKIHKLTSGLGKQLDFIGIFFSQLLRCNHYSNSISRWSFISFNNEWIGGFLIKLLFGAEWHETKYYHHPFLYHLEIIQRWEVHFLFPRNDHGPLGLLHAEDFPCKLSSCICLGIHLWVNCTRSPLSL